MRAFIGNGEVSDGTGEECHDFIGDRDQCCWWFEGIGSVIMV